MPTELRRTEIPGVYELRSQAFIDNRGAFVNAFRAQETAFKEVWDGRKIDQVNLSRTEAVGTVRGMHLQSHPYSEVKLVRCLKGRVWDVALDLRPGSTSFRKWQAVELSPELGNALLIPEGCAHGFQVLEKGSELLYLHSGAWVPEAEIGVRCDDPQLGISWPLPPTQLSDRDRCLPYLSDIIPIL